MHVHNNQIHIHTAVWHTASGTSHTSAVLVIMETISGRNLHDAGDCLVHFLQMLVSFN